MKRRACYYQTCGESVDDENDRYCKTCFNNIEHIMEEYKVSFPNQDSTLGHCSLCSPLCPDNCERKKNERYCEKHSTRKPTALECRAIHVNGDATITGALHCPALIERLLAMEERIHDLEQALLYAPGGVPYQEGEQRWREFVENEAATKQ